jgi:predicted Zn-dependent protease
MERELHRAQSELAKQDPAPYFLSYAVHDQSLATAAGTQGSLISSFHTHTRTADVIVRVGSPALDNTHEESRASAISTGMIPLADDAAAISRVLWQLTYNEYRKAAQAFLNVKTTTQVNAREEDTSPDFSSETPQVHTEYRRPPVAEEQPALETMVRRYSGWFAKYPYVYHSAVTVMVQRDLMRFASTEATRIVIPRATIRLVIEAETQADDGMRLVRVETFQPETLDQLPGDAEIASRVAKMAADLKALRAAPLAEPYDGPALLSGRAAAVLFHEVLGHRLEGHRQRGEKEGQTFTKKVNQPVLPEFLNVTDDPTERTWQGVPLAGAYDYDDEGVPARRVEVIQKGVLRNFLMSRMPVKGFDKSNGHGRAQPSMMPTGRQGNLIVTSSRTVKDADLRQKLIDEVKQQAKPYGLYFEDIEGGFTLTQRAVPQAFEVLPVLVWRVYADGRPDELVRGVDIVGTPLAAMSRVLLTGEKTEVFNGMCGAESGSIPVSAASPAMLFTELEVQKRSHALDRPPILPPPGADAAESKDATQTGAQR